VEPEPGLRRGGDVGYRFPAVPPALTSTDVFQTNIPTFATSSGVMPPETSAAVGHDAPRSAGDHATDRRSSAGSLQRAAISARARSRKRTISGQLLPSGLSVSPMTTRIGPGLGNQESAGSTSRVPRIVTGTTARPVSTAALKTPSRNGSSAGRSSPPRARSGQGARGARAAAA
jgi:hypothetical protein